MLLLDALREAAGAGCFGKLLLDADREAAGAGCCPALTGTTVKKAVLKTAAKTVTINTGK